MSESIRSALSQLEIAALQDGPPTDEQRLFWRRISMDAGRDYRELRYQLKHVLEMLERLNHA